MNILDDPGLKNSPIIIDMQKDIADIKAHLKLLFQAIEVLDKMKVTTVDPTKEGKDIKEKDDLIKKCRELKESL